MEWSKAHVGEWWEQRFNHHSADQASMRHSNLHEQNNKTTCSPSSNQSLVEAVGEGVQLATSSSLNAQIFINNIHLFAGGELQFLFIQTVTFPHWDAKILITLYFPHSFSMSQDEIPPVRAAGTMDMKFTSSSARAGLSLSRNNHVSLHCKNKRTR